MTTAAELRALAEEVEGLSGPSREMDVRIAGALFPITVSSLDEAIWSSGLLSGTKIRIEPYTSSIDAAASLMPEGWEVNVCDDRRQHQRWICEMEPPPGMERFEWVTGGQGPTEPLARCAAALRARAALLDEAAA